MIFVRQLVKDHNQFWVCSSDLSITGKNGKNPVYILLANIIEMKTHDYVLFSMLSISCEIKTRRFLLDTLELSKFVGREDYGSEAAIRTCLGFLSWKLGKTTDVHVVWQTV